MRLGTNTPRILIHRWRVVLGFILAPGLPALIIMFLPGVIIPNVIPIATLCYVGGIVLGVPCFFLFRKLSLYSLLLCMSVGFIIAVLTGMVAIVLYSNYVPGVTTFNSMANTLFHFVVFDGYSLLKFSWSFGFVGLFSATIFWFIAIFKNTRVVSEPPQSE